MPFRRSGALDYVKPSALLQGETDWHTRRLDKNIFNKYMSPPIQVISITFRLELNSHGAKLKTFADTYDDEQW